MIELGQLTLLKQSQQQTFRLLAPGEPKRKRLPRIICAVWCSAIAITARVSALLGCRSLSKIVNRAAAVVLTSTLNSSQRRPFLASARPFTLRCIVPEPTRYRAGKTWEPLYSNGRRLTPRTMHRRSVQVFSKLQSPQPVHPIRRRGCAHAQDEEKTQCFDGR
jgi:hypothetical protein